MQKAPSQTDHRCRDCGALLAHDHGTDLYCSACQRARCACDPRHDPTFADRLLDLLKANRRRPVNVYRELGVEPYGLIAWRCVQVHMRRFRRHGHRIVGRHDGTYEYRGQRRVRNGRARRRGRRASSGGITIESLEVNLSGTYDDPSDAGEAAMEAAVRRARQLAMSY